MFANMVYSENTASQFHQKEYDNPQKRRQGLYGLSIIAMTLKQKKENGFLDKILPSVIRSFSDKD